MPIVGQKAAMWMDAAFNSAGAQQEQQEQLAGDHRDCSKQPAVTHPGAKVQ